MPCESSDIEKLSTLEVFELYPKILKELKKRGVIEGKKLIGDYGEYLAREYYKKNPNFPNLGKAPTGTKNIDAVSRDGERYSIKTTSGTITSVFHSLNDLNEKKFEYVVIVILDDGYVLKNVLEIDWEQFLKIKKWKLPEKAWNIPVNASLMKMAKKVF